MQAGSVGRLRLGICAPLKCHVQVVAVWDAHGARQSQTEPGSANRANSERHGVRVGQLQRCVKAPPVNGRKQDCAHGCSMLQKMCAVLLHKMSCQKGGGREGGSQLVVGLGAGQLWFLLDDRTCLPAEWTCTDGHSVTG